MTELRIVFANGPGDQGSIPGRVIPKTLKMVHDTSLTHISKVKWSNPGKGVAPAPTPRVVAIEKRAFWSPTLLATYYISTLGWRGSISKVPHTEILMEWNNFVSPTCMHE